MSATCKLILAVFAMTLLLAVGHVPAQAEEDWTSHHAAVRFNAPWLEWTSDDWAVWEETIWSDSDAFLNEGPAWTVASAEGDQPQAAPEGDANYGDGNDPGPGRDTGPGSNDAPYSYYEPYPNPCWYYAPPIIWDPWYDWWPEPYYGYGCGFDFAFCPDWGWGCDLGWDWGRDYGYRGRWDHRWDNGGRFRDGDHNRWNTWSRSLGWQSWRNAPGGHSSHDYAFQPGQRGMSFAQSSGSQGIGSSSWDHFGDITGGQAMTFGLPTGINHNRASSWSPSPGAGHGAGVDASSVTHDHSLPGATPWRVVPPQSSAIGGSSHTLGSWLDYGSHGSTPMPSYNSGGRYGSSGNYGSGGSYDSHGWHGSTSSTHSYSAPSSASGSQSYSGGGSGSHDYGSRYSAPSSSSDPRSSSDPGSGRSYGSNSDSSSRGSDGGGSGGHGRH